jgi:LPXTG-motif cell wall-anchored protein
VATVGGACPGAVSPGTLVPICHATGVAGAPFQLLTVAESALAAHVAHGDVAPVNGACPGPVILPEVSEPFPPEVEGEVEDDDLDLEVEAQFVSAPIPAEVLGELPATGFNALAAALVALLLLLSGAGLSCAGRRRRGRLVAPAGPVEPLPQPDPPALQVSPSRATTEIAPTRAAGPGRPARTIGSLSQRGRHLAPGAPRPRSPFARLSLRTPGVRCWMRVIRLPGPSTSP